VPLADQVERFARVPLVEDHLIAPVAAAAQARAESLAGLRCEAPQDRRFAKDIRLRGLEHRREV
jgi:hypothetical protein